MSESVRSGGPGGLLGRLSGDSLAARYSRGAGWSLSGAVTAQSLTLVTSLVVARILGVTGFGELGMVQSTVGMFGVLGGMGLGMTATKYIAELRVTDPERAGRILTLTLRATVVTSGGVALLLFLAAPLLAARAINAPDLAGELRIASGLLFLNGVAATQTAALAGFEAFRHIAKVNFIRGLATLLTSVAGAALWGLPGAVWALVAAAAVAWFAGRMALHAECGKNGISGDVRGAWRERSVLWDFAAPAFLSGALASPVTWLGNALLVNQRNGYWEMGIFNAANQWRNAITFVPGILTQPALPILSSLYGPCGLRSYERVLWGSLLSVFLISTVMGAVVIAASPWILAAYGADFASGVATVRTLAIASVISCTAGVIGQAIAASGRMWSGFVLNLLWAAVFFGMSVWLVPRHGAQGLAAATLVSYLVHAGSVAAYTRRALLGK